MNRYIRRQFGEGFYRILQIIRGLVTLFPMLGVMFGVWKWGERNFRGWFPSTPGEDEWWFSDKVSDVRAIDDIGWYLLAAVVAYLLISIIALAIAWVVQGFKKH